MALLWAIDTTAPDLLKPDGRTVASRPVSTTLARIKRVNGFAF